MNAEIQAVLSGERRWACVCGDALAVLPTLPESVIDLVAADPPYGTTACKWDSVIPLEPMWGVLKRIIKPRGAVVLTASQPFTTALINSNPEWFKYCWVWRKSGCGAGFLNVKNAPVKVHEDVVVFSEGATANRSRRNMPYFPQGLRKAMNKNRYRTNEFSDAVGSRPCRQGSYQQEYENYPVSVLEFANDKDITHDTAKPVALMSYLIRTYTQPDEIVLDFCAGSGTTLVAALLTGRRAIGVEIDPAYHRIACDRLAVCDAEPPLLTAARTATLFDESEGLTNC